jgi:transcriptional regulator with XRE-family HTH domain
MEEAKSLSEYIQNQIKTRLEKMNLTPTAFSKKAGLSESATRNIVYGRTANPSIEYMIAIAKSLDCSVNDLIGDTTNQPFKKVSNNSNVTRSWNYELYQDCLSAVSSYLQLKDHKLNYDQVMFFVKEAYIYSIEGSSNKADPKFIKWLVDSNII